MQMKVILPVAGSWRYVMSVKGIVYTGLLALVLSGCSQTGKIAGTGKDGAERPGEDETEVLDEPREIVFDETVPEKEEETAKLNFEIAMVLPLYLDSIENEAGATPSDYLFPPSRMGLDFYEGALLALDSLKKSGFRGRIHVFDSNNDEAVMDRVLQEPALKKSNLIVGPVYNDNLRKMAQFAKQEKILMVSPLSPALIASDNPYYVQINPSLEVHLETIFNYTVNRLYRDNIVVYHQSTTQEGRYAGYLLNKLIDYMVTTGDTSIKFSEVVQKKAGDDGSSVNMDGADTTLYSKLKRGKNNVIIVPSIDNAFIYNTSRILYGLSDSYRITVIGLPNWENYSTLQLDYLNKLNVHFTSSYQLPVEFYSEKNSFYQSYLKKYHTEPSEYAVKGFDIVYYFGRLMLKYGVGYRERLSESTLYSIHTSFDIRPTYLEGVQPRLGDRYALPGINFYENKYVHLLRYDAYTIRRLN